MIKKIKHGINKCTVAFVISIPLFFQLSCKKIIDVPLPSNQLVTNAVFADSADAIAAVSGIYTASYGTGVLFSISSGHITLLAGMAADELYPDPAYNGTTNNGDYVQQSQIYANTIASGDQANKLISSVWSRSYQSIYQTNACIEGLAGSTGVSATLKSQLIGECKLFRALFYFNMVNLFGDVPLVIRTDYATNAVIPRAKVDIVYDQIINDLTDAKNLLTSSYPSATAGKGRPNKYAALALLARAYLYKRQWANAEVTATEVINSGQYSLSSLNNVFLANSSEAIWQIIPITKGLETTEGQQFVTLGGVRPVYGVNSSLINAFEPNDARKTNWLKANTLGLNIYYFPFKYKLQADNNTIPKENYMVLRLSEQYLIRAEARAEQGADLSGAASDLNVIRNRASLNNTLASNQSILLDAICHERQVELFCEWGHRWYDLKRTNRIDAVMGGATGACAAKGGVWNTNWQLWPIPYNELRSNPFLVQNPGYQ